MGVFPARAPFLVVERLFLVAALLAHGFFTKDKSVLPSTDVFFGLEPEDTGISLSRGFGSPLDEEALETGALFASLLSLAPDGGGFLVAGFVAAEELRGFTTFLTTASPLGAVVEWFLGFFGATSVFFTTFLAGGLTDSDLLPPLATVFSASAFLLRLAPEDDEFELLLEGDVDPEELDELDELEDEDFERLRLDVEVLRPVGRGIGGTLYSPGFGSARTVC